MRLSIPNSAIQPWSSDPHHCGASAKRRNREYYYMINDKTYAALPARHHAASGAKNSQEPAAPDRHDGACDTDRPLLFWGHVNCDGNDEVMNVHDLHPEFPGLTSASDYDAGTASQKGGGKPYRDMDSFEIFTTLHARFRNRDFCDETWILSKSSRHYTRGFETDFCDETWILSKPPRFEILTPATTTKNLRLRIRTDTTRAISKQTFAILKPSRLHAARDIPEGLRLHQAQHAR